MINSLDLLRRTKIGNAKTLTRWHQRGLIPAPVIGTHPNGKGKLAYWPDWVLEHCMKILALKKAGHSMLTIAAMLGMEKQEEIGAALRDGIRLGDELKTQKVKLSDKREVTLEEFFLSVIFNYIKRHLPAGDLINTLPARIRKENLLELMMLKFRQGYHPCLAFNTQEIRLLLDVQMSIVLSERGEQAAPLIVVPLAPALRQAFGMLGQDYPFKVIYFAAPRVIREEKGEMTEYGVLTMGGRFKLDLQDARSYGLDPDFLMTDAKGKK